MAKKRMDVERLVTWALLDQGLGWSMFGEVDNGTRHEDYGTRIDTSGIGVPNPSRLSDDDALVVRDVILMLPPDTSCHIILHGRIGSRPDWCEEGEGEWRQRRAGNGRLAWHYEKPGDRRSAKVPVMEFVGWRPQQVEVFRATYRVWWAGLEAMVPELNARLLSHEAFGPTVSREPWAEGATVILTPEGPLERPEKRPRRVSREYIERDGQMVPRPNVR